MKRHILTYSFGVIVVLCFLTVVAMLFAPRLGQSGFPSGGGAHRVGPAAPFVSPAAAIDEKALAETYGKLPMSFEPNLGQTDDAVRYLARGQGYSLFLSQRHATLSLHRYGKAGKIESRSAVRMTIEGASETAAITGENAGEGRSNYLIGNDPDKWRTAIPNYGRVKYSTVYDGIDLVYYGNGQQLEYDFVVRPGTDPGQIKLKFEGVESARIDDASGDLVLETGSGSLRQLKPFIYQDVDGGRTEIASTYSMSRENDAVNVSFNIAAYDTTKELVIDPILSYGTYLGGNTFDEGRSITVDAGGNAYIVGTAASRDFPTTPGTIKPAMLPRTDAPNSFWYDAFVTKINPSAERRRTTSPACGACGR